MERSYTNCSRPQVVDNSRQYLLLRTDILQRMAFGWLCSPWDFLENLGEFLSRFHSKRLWTKNNKGIETKKVQKKLC